MEERRRNTGKDVFTMYVSVTLNAQMQNKAENDTRKKDHSTEDGTLSLLLGAELSSKG